MRRHAKAIVAISALLLLNLALGASFALAAPPTASIDAPSAATKTSVHVSGEIDPADNDTYYTFETSTDGVSWSGFGFENQISAGSGPQQVSADLSGLTAGEDYSVRLAAYNFIDDFVFSNVESFTTEAVVAPTVTISAPTAVTASSAHFTGTIDPEAPEDDPLYEITWHFECVPACPEPLEGTIPADSVSHEVSADANGLEANKSYQVTLVAKNAGPQVASAPEAFKTAAATPIVETLHADRLDSGEVVLPGRVNPRNSATTYQFEWGTSSAYGNLAPATPAALGAEDGSFHIAKAPLSGLAVGPTYHFRIVVTNTETGEVVKGVDRTFVARVAPPTGSCPNEVFRIGFSADLPRCRAYEQITPVKKGGLELQSQIQNSTEIDPAGDSIRYTFNGALESAPASFQATAYRADRALGNWSSQGLGIPSGPYPGFSTTGGGISYSADRKHVINSSTLALTGDAVTGNINLYLKDTTTGDLRLVATAPKIFEVTNYNMPIKGTDSFDHVLFAATEALTPDAIDNGKRKLYEYANGQLRLVSRLPNDDSISTDWIESYEITRDGEKVFFSLRPNAQPLHAGALGLYARADGHTIPISASERAGEEGAIRSGDLKWTNADGSVLYFTTREPLTDDTPLGGEGYGYYLYRYEDGTLTFITDKIDNEVIASNDGGYIYYFREGNLGVLHNGQKKDIPVGSPENLTLSPNGKHIAFTSVVELTGSPNVNPATCRYFQINPCQQVFTYSSEDDILECASCRRDGGIPNADASFGKAPVGRFASGLGPAGTVITNDGEVFFNSPDPLVPGDENGRTDVYWFHDGFRGLISSGSSSDDSTLLGTAGDGRDVFFVTAQGLVGQDRDSFRDLYDARVGGGLASQYPPDAPPVCSGEGCKGAAPPPPGDSPRGSASFSSEKQDLAGATARCRAMGGKAGVALRKAKAKPPGDQRRSALKKASKLRQKAGKCWQGVA